MSQKILLIDDNLVAPRLNEAVLAQNFANCDVLLASKALEGFERFYVAQPDLIVLNDSLSDMDGDSVCYRLLNDPLTAHVPVLVMSNNGQAKALENKYANVVKTIEKPVEPDALLSAVNSVLSTAKAAPHPSSTILFRDAAKIVYSGHTGFFALRSAMQMAYGDKLNGSLRVFINRYPVELFMANGRFLFATSRNSQLYMKDSAVILSATNLGLILESQVNQTVTGCPMFLFLATRSGFPHDDVVQITREHGQRLFSYLFTAGRVNFEFEEMAAFPEYARNFPASPEDPDNWLLSSLRHVKFESMTAQQRPDPNGNPNYTRKGYELVQRLRLNDVEARFAAAINGSASLQHIAKKIGVPLNDALLIVFRFQALDIIDYWSSHVLSLPSGPTTPPGGASQFS